MNEQITYEFSNEVLIIEKGQDTCRVKYIGNKNIECLVTCKKSELNVVPVPLSETDVNASCVYIKFQSPIVIPSHGETELDIKVPMDIGITLKDEKSERTALVIPYKLKLALYGPPDIGLICRYIRPEDAERLREDFIYKLKLSIHNRYGSAVTISYVVFPLDFFREGRRELQMVVEDRETAHIFYGEMVSEPFSVSRLFLTNKRRFHMSYGY